MATRVLYPPIDPVTGASIPRGTQGTRAGEAALARAQHFVCLVRDESADGIGAYLDGLDTDTMYGLVVALAAMVPDDCTATELLSWMHAPEGAVA